MMPIDFENANVKIEVPEPRNEGMYTMYPAYEFRNEMDAPCLITLWQPSKEDIENIVAGRAIAVLQIGHGFNRIMLTTGE